MFHVQWCTNLRSVTWTKVSFLTQLAIVFELIHVGNAAHEAGEDAGNCGNGSAGISTISNLGKSRTAKNELTLPDLRAQGDVLLRGTSDLLGGHCDCDRLPFGICGC